MKDLAFKAVESAMAKGATYADARIVYSRAENIIVRNGLVDAVTSGESVGMGIRVIADGAWGFASNPDMTPEKTLKAVERAIATAKAAAIASTQPVLLAPVEPEVGSWRSPRVRDPFRIPFNDKLQLLFACDEAMSKISGLTSRMSGMNFLEEKKILVTSEGTVTEQDILHSGAGIQASASDGNTVQTRSWPSSFRGHLRMAGYEFIETLELLENAERIAAEAVSLLSCQPCPTEETTLIIGGSQLALQVHESCGHPVELDRVFGMEADYAGRSFLTPDKLGNFQYGSKIVNMTADATYPGLGGLAWDDEGVRGQRFPIIKDGIFTGYLSSRETAAKLDLPVTGCMRASSWHTPPLIRMTNINLEPGDSTLEELIAGTEKGILMTENSSWSIDDYRLNFQFSAEYGRLIENGKLGAMVKNPQYTGITPRFWNSCDGISNEATWELWGTPNCGKGQPCQIMRVGHGVPYARFRNVQVGSEK